MVWPKNFELVNSSLQFGRFSDIFAPNRPNFLRSRLRRSQYLHLVATVKCRGIVRAFVSQCVWHVFGVAVSFMWVACQSTNSWGSGIEVVKPVHFAYTVAKWLQSFDGNGRSSVVHSSFEIDSFHSYQAHNKRYYGNPLWSEASFAGWRI